MKEATIMSETRFPGQCAGRKTEQPRQKLPDVDWIKNAIVSRGLLLAYCKKYLPGGRVDGHEWRCAGIGGGKGNRFTMALWGEHAGVGIDWPSHPGPGSKYDIIDAIEASEGLLRAEAIARAREDLGMPIEAFDRYAEPEKTPEERQHDAEKKARDVAAALLTWNECEDVIGTPAEAYLRGRGITRALPLSFRYHPKLGYWEYRAADGEANAKPKAVRLGYFPALVCKIQRADGSFCGIHRIYLAEQIDLATGEVTVGKASVATPKKARGDLIGGYILCCDEEEFAGKVAVTEGIEDACAAWDVYDMPAVAAVSAAGVAAIVLPEFVDEPVFLPDNDPPRRDREGNIMLKDGKPIYAGLDAATTAVNRLRSETCSPRIQKVRGPTGGEKDVNAVLLAEQAMAGKATA